MSKIGFLFSGQGSQVVGMGQDLYQNNAIFKNYIEQLQAPFDFKQIMFEGPEEKLNDTKYTQACLVALSLSIAHTLKQEGLVADVVAGLSLGEYAAFAYSDVITSQDAINMVVYRGAQMSDACKQHEGHMSAILGLDIETIQAVLKQVEVGHCYVANDNCPGQVVIAGDQIGIEAANAKLLEAGALKVIPLKVSGAFHTPFFKEVGVKLQETFEQYSINEPKIPVIVNLTGQVYQGDFVKNMEQQVQSPVRFRESIETMLAMGVDTFVEIGPSKTLINFVKKINRKVKMYHIENTETLNQVIEKLKEESQ